MRRRPALRAANKKCENVARANGGYFAKIQIYSRQYRKEKIHGIVFCRGRSAFKATTCSAKLVFDFVQAVKRRIAQSVFQRNGQGEHGGTYQLLPSVRHFA